MNKIATIVFIITIMLAVFTGSVFGQTPQAGSSAQKNEPAVRLTDNRKTRLEAFLRASDSPCADYAKDFVDAADANDLDWRLLVSIAGIESSFCKHIPYNSYNAWGWGNGLSRFKNWPEGINIVSRSLKEKYVNKGLLTVDLIGPVYCPPSSTWSGKVKYFITQLDNFRPDPLTALNLSI